MQMSFVHTTHGNHLKPEHSTGPQHHHTGRGFSDIDILAKTPTICGYRTICYNLRPDAI